MTDFDIWDRNKVTVKMYLTKEIITWFTIIKLLQILIQINVSPPVSSLPDLFQISTSSINVTVIEINFHLHGNIHFLYIVSVYEKVHESKM